MAAAAPVTRHCANRSGRGAQRYGPARERRALPTERARPTRELLLSASPSVSVRPTLCQRSAGGITSGRGASPARTVVHCGNKRVSFRARPAGVAPHALAAATRRAPPLPSAVTDFAARHMAPARLFAPVTCPGLHAAHRASRRAGQPALLRRSLPVGVHLALARGGFAPSHALVGASTTGEDGENDTAAPQAAHLLKEEISTMDDRITGVLADIARKQTDIDAATAEIDAVELDMKQAKGSKVKYLRDKEMKLRDDRTKLHDVMIKLLENKTEHVRQRHKLVNELSRILIEKGQPTADAPINDLASAFMPTDVFLSPTNTSGMLLPEYGVFVAQPLFLSSAVADVYASYLAGEQGLQSLTEFGDEKAMHAYLTVYAPSWLKIQTRDKDAELTVIELLGGRRVGGFLKSMQLPWACKPEVAAVSELGHAGYTGAGKSFGPQGGIVVIREIITYGFFSMSASLFFAEGVLRLYAKPPVAYAIAAAGPMASFMAIEWVGKLFVSPLSQPFLLNSPEHQAAVAALPDLDYSEFWDVPLDAPANEWRSYPPGQSSSALVKWTIVPQGPDRRFLKIIRCTAFDKHPQGGPRRLRALHDTYAKYAAAWRDAASHTAGAPPCSLLPARLLYGTFVVAVDMPFLDGRDATLRDLADSQGAGAKALAAALAWLARNGLLYTDLRAANVRITPAGDAVLVDYDDVLVLDAPLASAASLEQALAGEAAGRGYGSCLDGVPGVRDALSDPTLWPDTPRG